MIFPLREPSDSVDKQGDFAHWRTVQLWRMWCYNPHTKAETASDKVSLVSLEAVENRQRSHEGSHDDRL